MLDMKGTIMKAHPFRFVGYLLFALIITVVTVVGLAIDHFRGALKRTA